MFVFTHTIYNSIVIFKTLGDIFSTVFKDTLNSILYSLTTAKASLNSIRTFCFKVNKCHAITDRSQPNFNTGYNYFLHDNFK